MAIDREEKLTFELYKELKDSFANNTMEKKYIFRGQSEKAGSNMWTRVG